MKLMLVNDTNVKEYVPDMPDEFFKMPYDQVLGNARTTIHFDTHYWRHPTGTIQFDTQYWRHVTGTIHFVPQTTGTNAICVWQRVRANLGRPPCACVCTCACASTLHGTVVQVHARTRAHGLRS